MRLSKNEIDVFVTVLSSYVDKGDGQLFLYGSRTDDALKGGDIDLLVVIRSFAKLKTVNGMRSNILSLFKKSLGERRIDLSVISEDEASADPFYKGVLLNAILLKEF